MTARRGGAVLPFHRVICARDMSPYDHGVSIPRYSNIRAILPRQETRIDSTPIIIVVVVACVLPRRVRVSLLVSNVRFAKYRAAES